MPSRTIKGAGFSEDILAFIGILSSRRVRYLIVGGEAVIFHGYPRVTGDIDFFYENKPANLRRLFTGLQEFWDGRVPGVRSVDELADPGMILQFGRPPHRIDLLNRIDGVTFSEAWPFRIKARLAAPTGPINTYYIDLRRLLKNKRAAARPKDLEDARFLSGQLPQRRRKKSKH